MANGKQEFPLSLVIKAVDKATAPLREINKRISQATAPFRQLNNSFKALSAEAGLPKLVKATRGVYDAVGGIGSAALQVGQRMLAMQAVGGYALFELAKSTVEAGSELAAMSKRVGMTVDAYASLRYAASTARIGSEQFAQGMTKLSFGLGRAKANSGELFEFLMKVAPALGLQMKYSKSTGDALVLLSKAFQRVQDPARRTALAMAAFGESGAAWGELLGGGPVALDELQKRFLELHGSSQELADGAVGSGNAWREMMAAFSGVKDSIGVALLPVFRELADTLRDFLVANRAGLSAWARETGKAVKDWISGGGLQRLAGELRSLGSSLSWVVAKLGGLGDALKLTAAIYIGAPLISATWALGSALWSLGAAAIPVALRGALLLGPALGRVGMALAPALASVAGAAGTALAGFSSSLAAAVAAAAPFVAAAAGLAAAGAQIYKHWEDLKFLFTDFTKPGGLLGTLAEALKDPLEALNPVATVRTAWRDWFGAPRMAPRPTIGAGAAVAAAPGAAKPAEAIVKVDFSNLPRGARVQADPKSTARLDLSMGYSSVLVSP